MCRWGDTADAVKDTSKYGPDDVDPTSAFYFCLLIIVVPPSPLLARFPDINLLAPRCSNRFWPTSDHHSSVLHFYRSSLL